MKGLKLFTRLFLTHAAIALATVVSLSVLSIYIQFREALIQRTIDQLSSINILKKNHIDEYFSKTRNTLVSTTQPSAGLGLHSMKERARLLNGNLEIHSSRDGTVVEGRIPITTNT